MCFNCINTDILFEHKIYYDECNYLHLAIRRLRDSKSIIIFTRTHVLITPTEVDTEACVMRNIIGKYIEWMPWDIVSNETAIKKLSNKFVEKFFKLKIFI
jgi:hypothetical protein